MSFQNKQSVFKSSKDGIKIFYQSWTKPNAKRVLVIQHGFGEHSDRYENIINKLQDDDINIYALDSRGHGRSEGIRGHVDQFQLYIDDLAELIHIAKEENNVSKVLLLGHSLGGVIVLQYVSEAYNQDNISALIVSAPALRVKMDLEKEIKKFLCEYLASLMPSMTTDANLDLNYLSRDRAVIDAYKRDPLVHGKISFQMGHNFFHLAEAIFHKAHVIKIPIIIIHGEKDGIADVDGSRELFKHLTVEDKQIKIYPSLYHELMNELPADREIVLNDLKQFIDRFK